MPPVTETKPRLSAEAQKEFERLLAQRLADEREKHKREIERLTSEIEQRDAVIAAAQERVPQLEAQIGALTTERDNARAQLEAASTQHAQAFGELSQRHERTLAEHRSFRVAHTIGEALVGANVLPTALRFATDAMVRESTFEHDEAGNIVAITWSGKRYTNAREAAASYLHTNEFLASAGSVIGGGTVRPNSGGAPVQRREVDPITMATEGWNQDPRR